MILPGDPLKPTWKPVYPLRPLETPMRPSKTHLRPAGTPVKPPGTQWNVPECPWNAPEAFWSTPEFPWTPQKSTWDLLVPHETRWYSLGYFKAPQKQSETPFEIPWFPMKPFETPWNAPETLWAWVLLYFRLQLNLGGTYNRNQEQCFWQWKKKFD